MTLSIPWGNFILRPFMCRQHSLHTLTYYSYNGSWVRKNKYSVLKESSILVFCGEWLLNAWQYTFKPIDFNRKPNHIRGLQIRKVNERGKQIIVSDLTSKPLPFLKQMKYKFLYVEWMSQFILFRPKAYQKGICMRAAALGPPSGWKSHDAASYLPLGPSQRWQRGKATSHLTSCQTD